MQEDNTNNPNSEPSQPLDSLLESYYSKYRRKYRCYPGLIFHQGKREMLQINVPAGDLPVLLQAKPATANDPNSGKNRPVVKGHADEIKKYVLDRARIGKPWVLGTLTANIAREKITIIELGAGVCLVAIPNDVALDITDGQHRTRAIQELILSADRHLIGNDEFPITLVLEDSDRQCQTDFRDMAQSAPLAKSLLVSYGEFLGRDGITQNLLDRVMMFQGKTEKIKASIGIRNKLIYTTNYIARSVSCAFVYNPDDEILDYDVEAATEALATAFNLFFSTCSDTKLIAEKKFEYLTTDEIINFKEDYIIGVSYGLEILGRLLNYTYNKSENHFNEAMVLRLAEIDWSRSNNLWRDNIVRLDPKPKNPAKPYKISFGAGSISTAVKIVKMELVWT